MAKSRLSFPCLNSYLKWRYDEDIPSERITSVRIESNGEVFIEYWR